MEEKSGVVEQAAVETGSKDETNGIEAQETRRATTGLSFSRRLSTEGVDPWSTVEWVYRDALIKGEGGKTVFEQKGVEFPAAWSQLATNVVTSKYFRGALGSALSLLVGNSLVRVAAPWRPSGHEGGV